MSVAKEMRFERWSPALGAEVLGLDVAGLISSESVPGLAEVGDKLYEALIDNQVLFIRDQSLSPDDHVTFAKLFGDLAPRHHSYTTHDENPDVVALEWKPGDRPDATEWHADMTFREHPPFASVLQAQEIPPVGGDTLWASMYSVYDALDPGFVKDLEQMEICHDGGQFRNGPYAERGNQGINEMLAETGSAVWPVISHHPVSGRPYVNVSESNSRWIMGTGAAESHRIVSYLLQVINRPDHQVRLRWQPGTIAIWDNRATQHYAVADYPDHRRLMHRVAVDTDRRLAESENAS